MKVYQLGEKGLSGTENNIDMDGYSVHFRRENWRYFINVRKRHRLKEVWDLRVKSCVIRCVGHYLCACLSLYFYPRILSHASLFCPVPQKLTSPEYRTEVLFPLFFHCVWPMGGTGRRAGREWAHGLYFTLPCLKGGGEKNETLGNTPL